MLAHILSVSWLHIRIRSGYKFFFSVPWFSLEQTQPLKQEGRENSTFRRRLDLHSSPVLQFKAKPYLKAADKIIEVVAQTNQQETRFEVERQKRVSTITNKMNNLFFCMRVWKFFLVNSYFVEHSFCKDYVSAKPEKFPSPNIYWMQKKQTEAITIPP